MIESTSLPTIIIYERHWDETPKKVLKNLLPKLAEEGYDTLCLEVPQDWETEEILLSHQQGLNFDSNLYSQAEQYLKNARINYSHFTKSVK